MIKICILKTKEYYYLILTGRWLKPYLEVFMQKILLI